MRPAAAAAGHLLPCHRHGRSLRVFLLYLIATDESTSVCIIEVPALVIFPGSRSALLTLRADPFCHCQMSVLELEIWRGLVRTYFWRSRSSDTCPVSAVSPRRARQRDGRQSHPRGCGSSSRRRPIGYQDGQPSGCQSRPSPQYTVCRSGHRAGSDAS